MGRRERKKLHTRQALRTAALRLFDERGFDATTIHDITEAADVAPRTFFLHFESKEDALLGDSRAQVDGFLDAFRSRPAEEEAFVAVCVALVHQLRAAEERADEILLQERLIENAPGLAGRVFQHYFEFEKMIASQVATRCDLDVNTDPYPSLLAAYVMTSVRIGTSLWYRNGGRVPLTEVVLDTLTALSDISSSPPPESGGGPIAQSDA